MSRLVDLSHDIGHGTITYPGLPGPVIEDHLGRAESRDHYAPGVEFHIGRISMVGNTGTYLDTPFHRFPDGFDLAALELDSAADLPGIVLDPADASLVATDLGGIDIDGRAVLIRTGWSRHWGTPTYGDQDHPHVTEEAAIALARGGAALVGIDSVNIDATTTGERPAHTILLKAGIPVVEHLTGLDALPMSGFRFFAVPPKVQSFGTFPVRAFAIVD